jgi:hypothetical protein
MRGGLVKANVGKVVKNLIFELMRGRVKTDVHVSAEVVFNQELTRVKMVDPAGELDEHEVAKKLGLMSSRAAEDAIESAEELLKHLMANQGECLGPSYFSVNIDRNGNAKLVLERKRISDDRILPETVDATRAAFHLAAIYLEDHTFVLPGAPQMN